MHATNFTAGNQVYWCSPNQTLSTGVLLTYRERGEVIGPPHDGRAGCYNVRFDNNPAPTTCHVSQLSRALPSRLLAGGYCMGDQLYWCSPSQTLSNGDKLLHGALGEVIGPATSAYPGRVCMLFPGNGPNGIQCDPSELSSEEPSRRGVRSRLREHRHKEPDKEQHGQQPKPEAAADRERVLQQRQEARQRGEQELEAALEGGDLECVPAAPARPPNPSPSPNQNPNPKLKPSPNLNPSPNPSPSPSPSPKPSPSPNPKPNPNPNALALQR